MTDILWWTHIKQNIPFWGKKTAFLLPSTYKIGKKKKLQKSPSSLFPRKEKPKKLARETLATASSSSIPGYVPYFDSSDFLYSFMLSSSFNWISSISKLLRFDFSSPSKYLDFCNFGLLDRFSMNCYIH